MAEPAESEQPLTEVDLRKFRPGIYIHYKGHLYEAMHLSHNASEDGRIEIAYIGLQLDEAHEGPRHATREFREFLFDIVHFDDGSICTHDPRECATARERFRYLGPTFEKYMLNQSQHTRPQPH